MNNKKPIGAVHLIRLPDNTWHDKVFMSYNAADEEVERLKCEKNIKFANIVTRFNKDNIPVGDYMLVLSHHMRCKIDGVTDDQTFDPRECYFSIDELMSKSNALRDLKGNLECEGNPVYHENINESPESFAITGPYYRTFADVGKVEVYLYKLTVRRLKIIKE